MTTGRRAPRIISSACATEAGDGIAPRSARRALRARCLRRVADDLILDLVGEDQVRDPSCVNRVLDRERHKFGVVRAGMQRLGRDGDISECGLKIEVLEGAATEDPRRHLTRQGDDRGSVLLGVIEPGQQVRGPRSGDADARRRTPGQLSVGRRGERCRTLVADADEGQFAAGLSAAHRVGEAEVGVADHAKDMGHAPGDQRLDDHIADRALVHRHIGEVDPDSVVTHFGRKACRCIGKRWWRVACQRVVVVTVPRAAQHPAFDRPLSEGSALVRAPIVECTVRPADSGQRQRPATDGHRRDTAVLDHIAVGDPAPRHR